MIHKGFQFRGLIFLILAGSLFLLSACGRKGPPVPPGFPDMAPVQALASSVEDGDVVLSWRPPAGRAGKVTTGYIIYRSMVDAGEETCEGCPVVFVRMKELKRGTETYMEKLLPGMRYIYKVVAVSEKGTTSPDSKIVRIEP